MFAAKKHELGEGQRIAARPEFSVFDHNPDPALDELVGLTAVLSNADFAYTGWMDSSRLLFKSRHGFEASEQARSSTACQWTIEMGEPVLIRDAGIDSRFPSEGIELAIRSGGGKPTHCWLHTLLQILSVYIF